MINPYTIIGGLLLAIALVLGGINVGKKLERQEWQGKELATQAAHYNELATEFSRYARMVDFNNRNTAKAADAHEKALALLATKHASTVADIRRTGGLRISRTVCKAGDAAATTAAGAVEPDAEASNTIRIPEQVEGRLFGIVEDADQLSEQLRSLQKWIRDNGLYGKDKE